MVHRRDKLRASKIMQERALTNSKIKMEWNQTLDEVLGNDKEGVTGVRLAAPTAAARANCRRAACSWRSATRRTRLPEGQFELNEKGYIRWTTAVPHEHQRRGRVRRRRRGRRLLRRRSHPPAPAAWRHSTRNVGSRQREFILNTSARIAVTRPTEGRDHSPTSNSAGDEKHRLDACKKGLESPTA